jgi:uncharacterized protein YbjT (DUF2867 family)
MKILIVGATGLVGSELVRQLHAAGHHVHALVRNRQKADQIAPFATPVIGDLSKPESLGAAFDGAEKVFILSPPIPATETLESNAFDAAEAAGARRIVYLSNYGAAAGDDDVHFDVHGRHEKRLKSLAVDWTILRPTRFMSYTPYVWSSVLNRGVLIESVVGAMTLVDTADVSAVAFRALTEDGHEGQSYDLTSNDLLTAEDLRQLYMRLLGREIRIFEGDLDALRTALIEGGAPSDYAPLMAGAFAKTAAGLWERTDVVAKVLGRPPRSYADWLDQHRPWAR